MSSSGEQRRLAPGQLAYLRAIAEGLPIVEAAFRYLQIESGREAEAAHQRIVQSAQALVRRRGDPRWRLIGMRLPSTASRPAPPTFEDWARDKGLEDWSFAELQDLYEGEFGKPDPDQRRRDSRNARLRKSRRQLLRELESAEVLVASEADPVASWFPSDVANKMGQLGVQTLRDLGQMVAQGGRWWLPLKGWGPKKASRVRTRLLELIPASYALRWVQQREPVHLDAPVPLAAAQRHLAAWIESISVAPTTRRQYRREVWRFISWSAENRKSIYELTSNECKAYFDFLGAVPMDWISKANVAPGEPNWAPFRGALNHASRRLAITVLKSFFNFLLSTGQVTINPWANISVRGPRRAVKGHAGDTVRQLRIPGPAANVSGQRIRWIAMFRLSVGLSPRQLISAQVGDVQSTPQGWVIKVRGSTGSREIPLPQEAVEATAAYLGSRGLKLGAVGQAQNAPLLASLKEPSASISYSALQQTLARLAKKSRNTR